MFEKISIIIIFILVLFFISCNKNNNDANTQKIKEPEQKEKELEQKEKQLNAKDSVKPQIKFNWEGEYYYKLTSDNPNHVWHYKLKIMKSEAGYQADLKINGHQTYYPLFCKVTEDSNSIKLTFDKYSDEHSSFLDFTKGDFILKLENRDTGLYSYFGKKAVIWENNPRNGINILKKIK